MSWITKERRALELSRRWPFFQLPLHDEGLKTKISKAPKETHGKRKESDYRMNMMIEAATKGFNNPSQFLIKSTFIVATKTCFHYQATAKLNYSINKLILHVKN